MCISQTYAEYTKDLIIITFLLIIIPAGTMLYDLKKRKESSEKNKGLKLKTKFIAIISFIIGIVYLLMTTVNTCIIHN
jgi:uncharacterized membrane protein YfcA